MKHTDAYISERIFVLYNIFDFHSGKNFVCLGGFYYIW